MAFVRLLKDLMKDKEIGKRFVPIIPDEARTFGMDSLFPTAKIYSPHGQQYDAVDRELLLSYKESDRRPDPARGHQRGRLDGLVHRRRHVVRHPRRADDPDLHLLLDVRLPAHRRRAVGGRATRWAAASCSAPPPGRTTLNGEGLQHEDGHSLLIAATNPAVRRVRPGVRVRDRVHHRGRAAAGCTARRSTRPRTSSTT